MKDSYKSFCENHPEVPLFLRYSWFASIFSNEEWDVLIAKKGDEITAIWPFVISKNKGMKSILSQFMSPYQGIWFNYPAEQNAINRKSFELEAANELITQLPKVAELNINFTPEFTNWLSFFWQGFTQTTRYTYILNDISDAEKCYRNFKETIRREIAKAETDLTIFNSTDIDKFYQLKLAYAKQHDQPYIVPEARLKAVHEYISKNNCGELLVALDKEQNIHSMLLYVWDSSSAYYLHGVTSPNYKTSGSMSLLLWESIKRSSKNVNRYNFEGSMVPSIERYFRSFGGDQVPYFNIRKVNSTLLKCYSFFRGL